MIFRLRSSLIIILFISFIFTITGCYKKNEEIVNNGSVHYEIFVGGFYDTNKDGIGDINGIREKIPYLKKLGVKRLWLMPINESTTYHKYDVVDYYNIDSTYGTNEDFKQLINELKDENIEVIIDLVLNHTSIEHEWFQKAINDYKNNNNTDESYKDYYNFSDVKLPGYEYISGVYYEARFWSGMPDLNLDNSKVFNELVDIAKYYLSLGVKGFRLDAVTYFFSGNDEKNIDFLKKFKDELIKEYEDVYIVAEAWTDNYTIEKYYESNIDSFFNFGYASHQGKLNLSLLSSNGRSFSKDYVDYIKRIKSKNEKAIDALFLSNHDQDRSSHFLSNTNKQKFAASVYLLMGGNPFIYYGEEIGLLGKGKDENKRLPMLWNDFQEGHANPPKGYDFSLINQIPTNVDKELKNKNSLLNHYIEVIKINNKYHNFLNGDIDYIDTGNDKISGFKFEKNSEHILIFHNFSNEEVTVELNQYKIMDQIIINNKSIFKSGNLTIGGYGTVILK